MRSSLRPLVALGLSLGAASGAVEVALRASPLQGMSAAGLVEWLVASVAIAMVFGLVAALAAGTAGRRPYGLVLAAFVGMHAAINYRFEFVLNAFVREPRVWGGILGILAGSLVVGLALDRPARSRVVVPGLLALAIAGAGASFLRVGGHGGAPRTRPNVVVISLDTTRPDHLSPYGHDIATPTLARLAREGATFDQAVAAAPITEPSHLAMFTGIPPVASGVVSNGTDLGDRPLFWKALRDAGYTTAGFVAGFPLHGKYGWGQGFDVYDDDFGAVAGLEALSLVKAWNQVAVKEHALRERSAARVLARAVPWIRAHRDEQMFAFVHFYDAHGPYDQPSNASLGPPPRDGSPLKLPAYWPPAARAVTSTDWLVRAYDQEIVALDAAVGQVLDALGPTADDTVIMVVADHGESLTEHGYLFDHGDDLYDPSLRVPWIVRFPAKVGAGTRIPCQVGGIDVAPTALALAGVADPVEREGLSRLQELTGGECRDRAVFASTVAGRLVENPPTDHAVRAAGKKLVRHEGAGEELYDLASDPGETTNLLPGAVSGELGALLDARLGGARSVSPSLDAETKSALKALGYLDDE